MPVRTDQTEASQPQEGYVDVNRSFRVLLGQHLEERANSEGRRKAAALTYLEFANGLNTSAFWKDILEEPLVVVLGEPGSGKTWEFREQARRLRAAGNFAFFVPLESVINSPLNSVLSPDDLKFYNDWIETRKRATFFVDSVDEAKFHRTTDFARAVERLRQSIGHLGASRVQLILSSRISEWSPATDAGIVSTSFPLLVNRPSAPNAEPARLCVVQIDPLDQPRVLNFAQAKGAADSDSFVRSLDEGFAWDFARRPYDVVGLINFWLREGRIGSLGEIVEQMISDDLLETQEKRTTDPLDSAKARRGAETLAAADIFCRELNIRIPDDAHVSDAPGLDSAEALPADWSAREQNALLARALFDSACYGRIRFHHRRMVEYLCAKWFERLLTRGLTSLAVENIFMAETAIGPVLRPSLAPVAAWLAIGDNIWNEKLRALLAVHAPELFLRYGDATLLRPDYKRRIILALLEDSRQGVKRWMPTEREAVHRLADPLLANFISERLLDPTATVEMKDLMLNLIREGRLTECCDPVLTLFSDPATSEDLRVDAVLCLRHSGSDSQRRRLVEIALALPTLTPDMAARICEAAFPKQMTVAEMGILLEKIESVTSERVHLSYYLSNLFEKRLAPEQFHAVMVELIRLGRIAPISSDEYGQPSISQRYRWIRKVLPTVILGLLRQSSLTEGEIASTCVAIELVGERIRDHSSSREFGEALVARINHHQALRKHYFWLHVNQIRLSGQVVRMHLLFGMNSLLELKSSDWAWWLADINCDLSQQDADLAYDCACQLLYMRGTKLRDANHFYRAIQNRPELRSRFLASIVPVIRREILGAWYRSKVTNLFRSRWWRMTGPWLKQKCDDIVFKWRMRINLGTLRSGENWRWLYAVLSEANESSKWGITNWEEARKVYGKRIAAAAEQGCKAAWRKHRAALPHERQDHDRVAIGVLVGLSGLNSELGESSAPIAKLSEAEAELAARYAVSEMNGFSLWLQPLAIRFPAIVKNILIQCLKSAWTVPGGRGNPHDIPSDLVHYGDGLRPLVADWLKGAMERNDPTNHTILRQAIRLLTSDDIGGVEVLRRVAPVRIINYAPPSPGFYLWMSIWLQLDASAAISYLEEILPSQESPVIIVVAICSHLQEDRRDDSARIRQPDYARAEPLARFIAVVFRYVRTADDIHYVGGHSPTDRDDAGRFRDRLIARLAESEDPEAENLLLALRQNPDLTLPHSWIKSLYEKRVIERSETAPWKETDVRDFEQNHERTPRNDQDLFNLIVDRLRDIANEVERSDNSPRGELNIQQEEAFLRRWITRRLRANARGRYTAPEESEVDWERYPDLRIENPSTNPVSIEMKWADKWTLPQLITGLEDQLVGHYLQSHSSRFGIYLLGYIGRKTIWRGAERERLSFADVVVKLKAHAQTIVNARPGQIGLEIVSIDFTTPPRG